MDNEVKIIEKYWDDFSVEFDAEHNTEDLRIWSSQLEQLLALSKGNKVLDIGTGTGFLAQLAYRLGCQVVGVDIAEKMLELAREKASRNQYKITYQSFDGKLLPFSDESFDRLMNCRLLWTLLEPEKTFREWKRVLKKGGRVLSFMRLPEKSEEYEDSWCYGDEFEKKLPLKYASVEEIMEFFQKAGFEKNTVFYLPPEMSHAELNPWYCIVSEKAEV